MVKWPAVKWSNFCYKLGPKKYSVCTPGDGDSWLSPAATPGPALLPRRGRDPHPSWWGSLLAECVIWQQPGDPRGTLTESLMESGSKMAETYMQVSVQSRAYLEQERSETWLWGSYIANYYQAMFSSKQIFQSVWQMCSERLKLLKQ